jgi:predicted nucleic-acid-binding protein
MLISRNEFMIFLYIETNFLVQFAKNQDEQSEILINNSLSFESLKILIPSVCCMEALSVLEDERRRRKDFEDRLTKEIRELKPHINSQHFKAIQKSFQSAKADNNAMAIDINNRVLQTLQWISEKVELIELNSLILKESIDNNLVSDPTDNLILHCLLHHSRRNLDATRVFLSNNSSDFGKKEIKTILENAGIEKYLTNTKDFLGWFDPDQLEKPH